MGAATVNSFSISMHAPRSPGAYPSGVSSNLRLGLRRTTLVDRARAILQEARPAAALDGDDLGDDRGRDLLGALGPEIQPGRPADPGEVGLRDVDALVPKLGQQALRPNRGSEPRDEPNGRGEQRAHVVLGA